jgi:hypothetical protein
MSSVRFSRAPHIRNLLEPIRDNAGIIEWKVSEFARIHSRLWPVRARDALGRYRENR